MRSRHLIGIASCPNRLWADVSPSTDYTDNRRNLWMALVNDHGAGAFVREDLGEEGVAFGAADEVGAVTTSFESHDNALQLGNHAAIGCAGPNQFAGFGGS